MNYHTLNQNLNANIDPIIVDRLRAMVLKSMEDLQAIEFDYNVQEVLVKKKRDRIETIEKEHNDTSFQLGNVTTQIALLDF